MMDRSTIEARLDVLLRDVAFPVRHTERQDLGHEWADLFRRKVHDRHDEPIQQVVFRIVLGGLCRRLFDAQTGSEIDAQLIRRLARLGKVHDLDDAADADVDLLEIGVGKRCRGIDHLRRNMTRPAAGGLLSAVRGTAEAVQALIELVD